MADAAPNPPLHDDLDDEPVERLWRSRLRWRLAGATMWPAFYALTTLEAVMLHWRPIAGEGIGVLPAFLLCGFFNLAVVAVGAPVAGWLLRRRVPRLPKDVAVDRAGTGLLGALAALLLVLGLAHHDDIVDREQDFSAQSAAVRRYVANQAPPEFRANIERADTYMAGPDLYRTCIPGPDPSKHLCLLVQTDQSPPGIRVDTSQEPNSRFAGPDNPGRRGGG
ncbi:hypothetical protein GKE82_13650 [Conexibacter sp. W3-3-2]|uniref:Uncharacterized protein n=1 Tax=Paraconexibacter algicola TaxID=2133960 RepID=A0A2T4UIE2_9ACTN|nr:MULTISPECIES: hypothetical protein [Solirubrobacterales]MTD45302.1 hypothetical protein [Conexibacter sp. W3-3-2]PTL58997.1 hypothetical protein C7Y72_04710 [Paraconexibacter algicola]